jgi:hypothetical protein
MPRVVVATLANPDALVRIWPSAAPPAPPDPTKLLLIAGHVIPGKMQSKPSACVELVQPPAEVAKSRDP